MADNVVTEEQKPDFSEDVEAIETCSCELKPMAEWVKLEDPEQCHECILKPIAEYYLSDLTAAGAKEQIDILNEAWESGEPEKVGEAFDKIKEQVGPKLQERLKTYDCFAQTYRPGEKVPETEEALDSNNDSV